jgi:transcription elongation factor Elf1
MRFVMVDYVDLQYAMMLSNRLNQFKVKSTNPYKINMRCPVCGDSQKSKHKARGWLLEDNKNAFRYHCFNCGASLGFRNFLKTVDQLVYNEYVTEKFKQNVVSVPETPKTEFKKPVFKDTGHLKKIKKISQLKHDHPVREYIDSRKIPTDQHYRLYYAPKFKTWINSILPGKFQSVEKDEPRLILPFLDEKGNLFGVSARGFDPNGLRYITIMFDDTKSKIFGLDEVDFSKTYFVVEGAIDSLFLDNAIAMAGADGNVSGLANIENAIFVFDSEPRNTEIRKRMEKLISQGHTVCVWPNNLPGKDINEMVLAGVKNIEKIIKENSYKGLEGQLRLSTWRRT